MQDELSPATGGRGPALGPYRCVAFPWWNRKSYPLLLPLAGAMPGMDTLATVSDVLCLWDTGTGWLGSPRTFDVVGAKTTSACVWNQKGEESTAVPHRLKITHVSVAVSGAHGGTD